MSKLFWWIVSNGLRQARMAATGLHYSLLKYVEWAEGKYLDSAKGTGPGK